MSVEALVLQGGSLAVVCFVFILFVRHILEAAKLDRKQHAADVKEFTKTIQEFCTAVIASLDAVGSDQDKMRCCIEQQNAVLASVLRLQEMIANEWDINGGRGGGGR